LGWNPYTWHFLVHHGRNEFARDGHCHINGIEAFWSYTRGGLQSLTGSGRTLNPLSRSAEWRWRCDHHELAKELWFLLKKYHHLL